MWSRHDRVRWIGVKDNSWAAPGTGVVVDVSEKRRGFGPPRLNAPPEGPAVCVKLDGDKGHVVWLDPNEIMADLTAAT